MKLNVAVSGAMAASVVTLRLPVAVLWFPAAELMTWTPMVQVSIAASDLPVQVLEDTENCP